MVVERNPLDVVDRFLFLAEKATRGKDVLDNSKARIQLNNTFMALNKQIRGVIASGDVEGLIEMQRAALRFTSEVYGREGDLQSLSLLRNVEEQFKLVQDPDKYKKTVEDDLGRKNMAALTKAPDDIVAQFAKRQTANMTKFSGFEMPAEKQFLTLQKDMAQSLLKIYKVQQNQALGFDMGRKKAKGLTR